MSIIYIFSLIILVVSYLLVYKREEKQNLVFSIIISGILLIGYNIVICTFMYFLYIKSTLLNLSICNIIISIIPIIFIIKTKKIQKYHVDIIDLHAIIILVVLTITIVICNYGIPIKIKHGITDATTHYFAADDFYRYSTLLPRENSDVINWIGITNLMTGAYINTGIFLKLFDGIISETYFCQLYFLFDILIWILSSLLMYTLLAMNNKKTKHKILAIVFTLFYIFAYQLNSLFAGFSYLGVGLDIIIGILIIMKSNIPKLYKRIGLFILNFGLMFSYYYFAPVIFLAILWQLRKDKKEKGKKLINLEILTDVLVTLFIPGLIGVIYFVALPLINSSTGLINYISAIGTEGFIYENLISNIIIYLLLAEIYLIYSFIKKKNEFNSKFLFLNTIFVLLIFAGLKFKIVSEYYFYLIAYIGDADREHTGYPTIYRVDRIADYKATDETFYIPYKDRFAEGEFRNRIPFMYSGKLQKRSFLYKGPDINAVLDRMPTAEAVKREDGSYQVTVEVYGDKGLSMWLGSQGEHVE